jgi:glycine cleavage system H protein
MSLIPDDLRYTKEHEWIRVTGNRVRLGITDHAQHELTDVVFVEFPAVGKELKKGQVLGVVESVKAVSEIFAPVSGKVVAVNKTLDERPEAVNKDPYGEGWIAELEVADPGESAGLMDSKAYHAHVGS